MKYTLGPWFARKVEKQCTAVGAQTLIAKVFSESYNDYENEKANADLIAASPDLLEVLKERGHPLDDGTFCYCGLFDLHGEHTAGCLRVRAVIAKAEGHTS